MAQRAIKRLTDVKYEYEAYLTRGSCRARGGGWVPGTSVELRIRAPGHLVHTRSGSQYVNFADRTYGSRCARACAAVTIAVWSANIHKQRLQSAFLRIGRPLLAEAIEEALWKPVLRSNRIFNAAGTNHCWAETLFSTSIFRSGPRKRLFQQPLPKTDDQGMLANAQIGKVMPASPEFTEVRSRSKSEVCSGP